MKIRQIQSLLGADLICGESELDSDVYSACSSDMMSDVLAFVKDQGVLLTGLVNTQVIRTAAMMDMRCVVFVRGKKPGEDVVSLGEESGIVIMSSGLRMYEACGRLYNAGLCAGSAAATEDENV